MNEKIKNILLYGKDFCEDTAENLKETLLTAVDSAKLQYRIVSQRKQLNALYSSLGRMCIEGQDEMEAEMANLLPRIKKKEEMLAGLEDQLRIVSGKVICPDCGRFMSEKYVFCPWCGKVTGSDFEPPEADISCEELYDIREIDGNV